VRLWEGTGRRSDPCLLRARSIPWHSRRDLDLTPLHPIPTSHSAIVFTVYPSHPARSDADGP
jgi:hypothetical protein